MYSFFDFFRDEKVVSFAKPTGKMRIYLNTPTPNLHAAYFSHVERNEDNIAKGEIVEIFCKNYFLGFARVVTFRTLSFSSLTDMITFSTAGMNVQQFAAILQQRYKDLQRDDNMVHVIFCWTMINRSNVEQLLNASNIPGHGTNKL